MFCEYLFVNENCFPAQKYLPQGRSTAMGHTLTKTDGHFLPMIYVTEIIET